MGNKGNSSFFYGLLFFVLFGIVSMLIFSKAIDSPILENNQKKFEIFIPKEGRLLSYVIDSLGSLGQIKYSQAISILSDLRGYDSAKFGYYKIDSTIGVMQFLRKLTFGYEDPLNVRIGGYKSREEYLKELSNVFPWSLDSLRTYLGNDTSWSRIIPNTYEMYWSSNPRKISNRLRREYNVFWSNYRRNRAEDLGFSPDDIMIIASISQAETKALDELPRIAALYMSRLRIGKRLESDPTAVYAYREMNPGTDIVRRVSRKMTRVNHPYNTYNIPGLPPSPIATVEPEIIDAVLSAIPKGELYMCADPERIGYHNFTSSFRQHLINSSKYHRSLNRRGIRQ
tara:strand:- start:470 stop:1492 length:1023 start_codon:yes stop_codon:yes gene_type:complete